MEIKLRRFEYKEECTVGRLYLDGRYECYTLEDTVREKGIKVYGKTAIPLGKYEIILDFSNRFQKILPRLLEVPGFEGVRIHSGNTSKDTEGCILVGTVWNGVDSVLKSHAAFDKLFEQMEDVYHRGEKIFITLEAE